jgi:hypothetical protein
MSGFSVLVALNALALKRLRLPRAETSAEHAIAERPKDVCGAVRGVTGRRFEGLRCGAVAATLVHGSASTRRTAALAVPRPVTSASGPAVAAINSVPAVTA